MIGAWPLLPLFCKFRKPSLQELLEKMMSIGFEGIMLSSRYLESTDDKYVKEIRRKLEELGLYVELGVSTDPRALKKELEIASLLGAEVVSSAFGYLTRYPPRPRIKTKTDWHRFRRFVIRRVRGADKLAGKHNVEMAIENHMDFTSDELLDIIETSGGDHVGIRLDTGNQLCLVEDCVEAAEKLAPYVLCTHLKDFLLKETKSGLATYCVAIGDGHADVDKQVQAVRRYRRLNNWTIETFPGQVNEGRSGESLIPLCDESFWGSYDPPRDALDLVKAVNMVRNNPKELPSYFVTEAEMAKKTPEEQIEWEIEEWKRNVAYAKNVLKLGGSGRRRG